MLTNSLKCLSARRNLKFPKIIYKISSSISSLPLDDSSWIIMSRRFNNMGPPRKIPRYMASSISPFPLSLNQYNDFCAPNFRMDPPPPPPVLMNCGELREHHHGSIVEMDGKVNRIRMGRFIELKDQYGITQLVAPVDNISVSKRFTNMPLESFITVVGVVKKRPDNLKNSSIPTGGIEVHVDDITRVQKIYRSYRSRDSFGSRRNYSTMASSRSPNNERLITAITCNEYRKAGNSETLINWFHNREYTCNSLRLCDVNKTVSLIGWIEKKASKFVQLCDGYGHTQIVIDSDEIRNRINDSKETDILLLKGRVVARPQTHVTHNSNTGEIEVYAESVSILDATGEYTGPIREIAKENPEEASVSNGHNSIKKTEISADVNEYTYRTHNCGELRENHAGMKATLCGWLEFSRMSRFLTLRDGYGHTQVLVPKELIASVNLDSIPFESIVKVVGLVVLRPPKMRNEGMATGGIEILLESLEVLNTAKNHLPIEVRSFNRPKESLRMEYRYIDLRYLDMQRNLRTRSHVLMKMREYLINYSGFVEVETPTLFRRTPGGAQEFVVPTRKAGSFYALVQSPQQFKQMLMAGAIDRYFQIARCYRDETTTPNRQPEFTQLDIELSFTDRDSILKLIENILEYSWPKEFGDIQKPFPHMTFNEAMENYGTDKPDTRSNELLLKNVTDAVSANKELINNNDFGAYAITLQKTMANCPDTIKAALMNIARKDDVKFLISEVTEDPLVWASSGSENLSEAVTKLLVKNLELSAKDTIILAYGNKSNVQNLLGKIRTELILHFINKGILPEFYDKQLNFLWIVDFPLFTPNETTGELETTHHPFTAPHPDDMRYLDNPVDYRKARSLAYDLVLNGNEVGGGSIRIHNAELQKNVLTDILKINSSQLSHLLDALESGCPPHGGIALGLDRLLSLMCKTNSIRDVIAFPKSLDGKDLLSKAPCAITKEELDLYHLKIITENQSQ